MVDDRECADVEFLAGDQATPVYAAKVVLIARSPVFRALLNGSFREGLPTTTATATSSSSSSLSVSCSTPASPSLPPVFWHSVAVPDLEPRALRHLLYWCYTDALHPDMSAPSDVDPPSVPSQFERDLVHLYAAADRYLLEPCMQLAEDELCKVYQSNGTGAMATFDMALGPAPELAKSVCLPDICTYAGWYLQDCDDPERREQWLNMSPAAAEEVVAADLQNISEADLFRAIQRRYMHHLHHQSMSQSAALEKVAGLLRRIETRLMTGQEIREVVEPSALLSADELIRVYRRAACSHSFVVPHLTDTTARDFDDRVTVGKVVWRISVSPGETGPQVQFIIEPRPGVDPPSWVSLKGISLTVFLNRRRIAKVALDGSAAVPRTVAHPIDVPYDAAIVRLTILVRLSMNALQEEAEEEVEAEASGNDGDEI